MDNQKNGVLNAKDLAKRLHQNNIYAVLMKFHEVMVPPSGPLIMSEAEFNLHRKEYTISDELEALLLELQPWGIALYVTDFTDTKMRYY